MIRIDGRILFLTLFTFASVAQQAPKPLYVVDISSLVPQGGGGGTVTVFSDHNVSSPLPQGSTAGANGTVTFLADHVLAVGMCFKSTCNVQTIDVADAEPRVLGNAQGIERYRAILRTDDGVLLSGVRRGRESGAILLSRDLQMPRWIPAIPGALASGERTKQSLDATRVLHETFTRRVGAAQAFKEKALAVATMGMSTDGDVPNGEMIRVMDTRTGKRCFEWYGTEKLLPPFSDHADIDPSGRLVAIMTQGRLSIFALPDSCRAK
jgi:hypothetical protein